MLDAKILAAVFTALTAVAATTGGGTVEKGDFQNKDFSLDSLSSIPSLDILNKIKSFTRNQPEPENTIEANLTVQDLNKKNIRLRGSDIHIPNLRDISFEGKNLSSDEIIEIQGFDGKLKLKNGSSIDGTSSKLTSSGVNITGESDIQHNLDKDKIKLIEVEKIDLKYSKASGNIRSNSTTTEIDESGEVEIKSFSGNLSIGVKNKTMSLDGKVYSFKSGEFEFGG